MKDAVEPYDRLPAVIIDLDRAAQTQNISEELVHNSLPQDAYRSA